MSPLEKKRLQQVNAADAITAIGGAANFQLCTVIVCKLGPRRVDRQTDEASTSGESSPDRGTGAPEPWLTHICMKNLLF